MRRLLFLLPVLMSMGSFSQKTGSVYSPGPYEIVVDPRSLRGEAGWSWMKIHDIDDTIPRRTAECLHLKVEFKMLSFLMDKYSEFVVWDAGYLGMQMGTINSATVGSQLPKGDISREGKFTVSTQFGYDLYMGYRNKYWGLLAGVRPQWTSAFTGDFSLSPSAGGFDLLRFSYPLALRAEWRPFAHFEYRIIAVAWNSFFGETDGSGIHLELPTFPSKRYWLFAEYGIQKSTWDYLSTEQGPLGSFRTFTVGLRVGSLM
ncbi:MAG: hypothetical protein K1X54_10900 [Flavobacteriales bacterium]|nr:hypothetical protein [Flavobacteriales bacterium]